MNINDDDIEIQYMPSMVTNSRSASMKKLAKKPQPKPNPLPIVTKNKQFDYDQLDQLLASPGKPVTYKTGQDKNKNSSSNIGGNKIKDKDDIDSFFDQPTLPIYNKNTQKNIKVQPVVVNKIRPVTAHNTNTSLSLAQDTILQQHEPKNTSTFKFKRPQTAVSTTKNPILQQQPQLTITPSTRMMKPPLRKRQSQKPVQKPKQQLTKSIGLVLQDQPRKVTTNNVKQETKLKIPQFSQRKSSIQLNTDQFNLSLDDQSVNKNKNQSKINSQSHFNLPNNRINLQKQKQQKLQPVNKKFQLIPESKLQQKKQQKKSYWQTPIQQNIPKKYNQVQTTTKNNFQSTLTQAITPQMSHIQLQKQIQFIKRNYQKHIDSLQKNLQQQIKINKETRQRLLNETNIMIQNQRQRIKKIHNEQIQRIKHLNQWQKKKMQQNYINQIQLLKIQLQNNTYYNKQKPSQVQYNIQKYTNRKQLQYLQQKLKFQKKLLQQKLKIIDKKQLQQQQRQNHFNKYKRIQQQKLRNQQKRIFQYQLDVKKQILNQKRMIEQEKQNIATQLASIQIDNYKRQQNVQQLKNQLREQKEILAKQRIQLKNMSNNLTLQYQKKVNQLKQQKQRFTKLQSQLINKIKIVQSTRQRLNTTNPTKTKQNNWVNITLTNQQQTQSQINKNNMSIDKINQKRKFDNTQTRFMGMAASLKESMKVEKKGKDFDINNYLMSMAHYTRARDKAN